MTRMDTAVVGGSCTRQETVASQKQAWGGAARCADQTRAPAAAIPQVGGPGGVPRSAHWGFCLPAAARSGQSQDSHSWTDGGGLAVS